MVEVVAGTTAPNHDSDVVPSKTGPVYVPGGTFFRDVGHTRLRAANRRVDNHNNNVKRTTHIHTYRNTAHERDVERSKPA